MGRQDTDGGREGGLALWWSWGTQVAWMVSAPVTNHFGFIREQLVPPYEGQDAHRPSPLHPIPILQYFQDSHILLYSLNVECPLKSSHADIGSQFVVLWEAVGTLSTGPNWRTHVQYSCG